MLVLEPWEAVKVHRDGDRIRVNGPLWTEGGRNRLPTVYVSEDGDRWEVEILADRYERRRKR